MRKVQTQWMTCSSCGQKFNFSETKTPPFCSERCQMIDLGRWLGEEISVPHEGGPVDGEAVGDPEGQRNRDEHGGNDQDDGWDE